MFALCAFVRKCCFKTTGFYLPFETFFINSCLVILGEIEYFAFT